MNTSNDPDNISLLLPWYVNGTLDEAEHAQVTQALANSATLRAEAGWLHDLQARLQTAAPLADAEPAWDRLQQLVAAEREGRVVALPSPSSRQKVSRFVPLAMAATLVLGIFIGKSGLLQSDDITPLSERQAAASHAHIQVTFKSTSTEGEIRRLVHAVKAEIVSGPGALGVYTFRVPADTSKGALDALRARRDLVETATLVKP